MKNKYLWQINNDYAEGESMKMCFDGVIKLEFHSAKVTSDSGHFAASS